MNNRKQKEEKEISKSKKFDPPVISVIHLTETDIITSSGLGDERDDEGEREK